MLQPAWCSRSPGCHEPLCCSAAELLQSYVTTLIISVSLLSDLQCCSAADCRVKTWPSKWLEGGVAECGGVTRLMMCTWHQHCSIYTICTICRTCTICTLCTIYTICTLATYLPISPRQTRAEVGLNTALGRVTLLSFLWRTRAERQWEGRMKIWNTGYCR